MFFRKVGSPQCSQAQEANARDSDKAEQDYQQTGFRINVVHD